MKKLLKTLSFLSLVCSVSQEALAVRQSALVRAAQDGLKNNQVSLETAVRTFKKAGVEVHAVVAQALLTRIQKKEISPQAALQEAKNAGVNLEKELAPYLFPEHWREFFTHFSSLNYQQTVRELYNFATYSHHAPFSAPVLADLDPTLMLDGEKLSQWLITTRNKAFAPGGCLHYYPEHQPHFNKFIVASLLKEELKPFEGNNDFLCAGIFSVVKETLNQERDLRTQIQETYAQRLGRIDCDGEDIASLVAQKIVSPQPLSQAEAINQVRIAKRAASLRALLNEEACMQVARKITLENKSRAVALAEVLGE